MKHIPFWCCAVLISGLTTVALSRPVKADSTAAYCTYVNSTNPTIPVAMKGPCGFSQYSGNIYVEFEGVTHHYPAREQGRLYTRINRSEGIWLSSPDAQMTVFWEKPARELGGV